MLCQTRVQVSNNSPTLDYFFTMRTQNFFISPNKKRKKFRDCIRWNNFIQFKCRKKQCFSNDQNFSSIWKLMHFFMYTSQITAKFVNKFQKIFFLGETAKSFRKQGAKF